MIEKVMEMPKPIIKKRIDTSGYCCKDFAKMKQIDRVFHIEDNVHKCPYCGGITERFI